MKGVSWMALVSLLVGAGGCHTTVQAGHVLTPESERLIRDNQPRAPLEVVVPVGAADHADATIVRVLPDQAVVWVSDHELSVPAAAIHSVDVTDHASGAAKGALVGLLGGAAVGALVGSQAGSDNHGDTGGAFSRKASMVFGGAVLGLFGTFVGTIVGGMRGDVTSYHFD